MSPMRTLLDIQENFQFLITHVTRQIDDCFSHLKQESKLSPAKFEARDNYVDILKSIIEQKSYSRLSRNDGWTDKSVEMIKAINKITTNLERIGDFAVNILRQMKYFEDKGYLKQYNLDAFHEAIRAGLTLIDNALFKLEINSALRICRKEMALDELFEEAFNDLLGRFKDPREHHKNLITALFIFRYFERTGDALLNIGEAIISATLGERLKIHQYTALEESLSTAEDISSGGELSYETIAETKSGSRIGLITDDEAEDGPSQIIFKNGDKKKILQEKELIERWEKLFPGIPPKVYGYQEHERDSSLLLQYLDGKTIQDLIVNGTVELLKEALDCLFETLKETWSRTRTDTPVNGNFIQQLKERLEDVFVIHPHFSETKMQIGTLNILSLDYLSKAAVGINSKLKAPFSIFIHGDFNSDNILYSFKEKKINFIDLHRSRHFDYVQDISVFIVSNFRLPFVDEISRDVINWVSERFLEFARSQAEKFGDETFNARLALGLVRSLITSTRFVLNKDLAKTMYHRGVYLLEQIVNYEGDYRDFTFPQNILAF